MIVFRKRFLNKALKLDKYLREEFGLIVAEHFLDNIERTTRLLEAYPELGRQTKVHGIRSKLIPPYVRIYYTIKKGNIEVLNMYDMRQAPIKNIYE